MIELGARKLECVPWGQKTVWRKGYKSRLCMQSGVQDHTWFSIVLQGLIETLCCIDPMHQHCTKSSKETTKRWIPNMTIFLYRNHKMLRISNVLKTLVSKQQPYHCQKKMSITCKSLEHTSCWMQHISCWMTEFCDDVQMKWLFLTLNSHPWLLFFWFMSIKKPSCASWELERGKDRHPMCKSF